LKAPTGRPYAPRLELSRWAARPLGGDMQSIVRSRFVRVMAVGLVCSALGVLGSVSGAAAAPANPSQLCGDDDVYVRVTEWRGATIVRELPIATHGGCASSWATGQMSVAAVVSQCTRLEEGTVRPDGSFFQLTYPHVFYDNPGWTADNRAGCVRVLHGLATGELDADVLPFPF
jgi:hypothetical protein